MSRKVLHFTEDVLFRECYFENEHSHYDILLHDWLDTQLNCVRTPSPDRPEELTPNWLNFIESYSRTEFTNPGDRLIALSSLAKAIRPFFGNSQ
jgi:hypothetical protein